MIKVLVWNFAKDTGYLDGAMNILERQHNGVEVVGVTAGAPIQLAKDGKIVPFIPLAEINRVWGGGIMMSSSSSEQKHPEQAEQT